VPVAQSPATSQLWSGLGRAFGGALIFGLPMLMTMEMWWLGFYVDRLRLALLLMVTIPLLTVLARQVGFEKTSRWKDAARDGLIAMGIGALASAVILTLFGVITFETPLREIVGKIAIQAVPASIGALLARSQLGGDGGRADDKDETYWGELFLMGLGALFLSLNMAPTEEMILISYLMTPWHSLGLIGLSLVLMHGFVYAVSFKGGSELSPEMPWWSGFFRFTLVGYGLCLLLSFGVLWIFGRTEDVSFQQNLRSVIVLGFPAAIGASAARLIL